MAKISGWEKFRKAVTGSYSEKLTITLAQEELARRYAAVQKAKVEEIKKTSAGTGKVASADTKKPAAKKPSTPKAKPAAKKPAAKKAK